MLRHIGLALLLMGFGSVALAVNTGNRLPVKVGDGFGDRASEPRQGGDTIYDATVIPAVPFSDTGATCAYTNDYDEICPYTGSTSPDVVYAYTPASMGAISIDLCASQYDTKVYVYAGTVGNLVACNDDASCGYSGYQSRIENLDLTAGVTYYIVVDGYGGSCGTYNLQFGPCCGPELVCPSGALHEGEPDCQDGYVDQYNGGCNSTGWTAIEAQAGGCADMCGKSGDYLYNGLSYRDTDWYTVTGNGNPVVMQCIAEFPLQIILIWWTDCNYLQYVIATAGVLQMATLSYPVADGAEAWLWVGPSVFSGVPCASDYVMDVCGIEGPPPVPAEGRTWGAIKASYRR